MSGKFQINWVNPPNRQFKPGTKVEITEGYLKGERATVEVNPEMGTHTQRDGDWIEVGIRYEKDGEKVGKAILLTQWEDIEHLRVVV